MKCHNLNCNKLVPKGRSKYCSFDCAYEVQLRTGTEKRRNHRLSLDWRKEKQKVDSVKDGAELNTSNKLKIYFILGEKTRLIKIGTSYDVLTRLGNMQVGSPDKLILLGTIDVNQKHTEITEIELHRKFKDLHSHREWFKIGDSLVEFLKIFNILIPNPD